MNKWITGIAVAVIATGTAISFAVMHRTRTGLREQNESFQLQTERATQLGIENERLSNVVAQLQSSQALSKDQLRELLRLRNEAGLLRGADQEKEQLQSNNARLIAAAAKSAQQLAEAQAAPNYWARDQLTFAGYADPESAVRSFLWYMNNGNFSTWKSVCTPECWTKMEAEWDRHGRSEAQRMAEMKGMAEAMISQSVGFHVLDRKMTGPDEAIVNLSFDGEGKARKLVLRRIGNEWKFHNMIFAGQDEPKR